jgi:hypothetical protein
MAGERDRPGVADVQDDHGLCLASAVHPHPHDLPEHLVGHRCSPNQLERSVLDRSLGRFLDLWSRSSAGFTVVLPLPVTVS